MNKLSELHKVTKLYPTFINIIFNFVECHQVTLSHKCSINRRISKGDVPQLCKMVITVNSSRKPWFRKPKYIERFMLWNFTFKEHKCLELPSKKSSISNYYFSVKSCRWFIKPKYTDCL